MCGAGESCCLPLLTGTTCVCLSQLRIIQAFVDMVQLIQQANVSVDGARHGKAIAKLQSREATLKAELAAARRRISELNETVDILRGGQGKPVVRAVKGVCVCVCVCVCVYEAPWV